MYGIENEAQPDVFENAFSGLWWAIATLTTVGYGDIYPVTAAGKVLGALIALLGIGLVAVPTGIISAGFTEDISQEKDAAKEDGNFCPRCGKRIDDR
jgi:voltage-gated potassium channel